MKVYVACYIGTDTDDILGVYTDIEMARESIRMDYEDTEIDYVPDEKEIGDDHIYIAKVGGWFDEWYILEKELYGR